MTFTLHTSYTNQSTISSRQKKLVVFPFSRKSDYFVEQTEIARKNEKEGKRKSITTGSKKFWQTIPASKYIKNHQFYVVHAAWIPCYYCYYRHHHFSALGLSEKVFRHIHSSIVCIVGNLDVDQCNVKIGCKTRQKAGNSHWRKKTQRTMCKMGENNGKYMKLTENRSIICRWHIYSLPLCIFELYNAIFRDRMDTISRP